MYYEHKSCNRIFRYYPKQSIDTKERVLFALSLDSIIVIEDMISYKPKISTLSSCIHVYSLTQNKVNKNTVVGRSVYSYVNM